MRDVTSQMRVLICGGRDYQNRAAVFAALDRSARIHIDLTGDDDIFVIHGACCFRGRPLELRGADRWADEWAKENEYPVVAVPAKWSQHDKAAGPIRNAYMLKTFVPTNVIAFPGDSGTANMTDLARKAGLVVWEPEKISLPRRVTR